MIVNLLLIACTTSPDATPLDPMGRIVGTVVGTDGNPIEGVLVEADGLAASTDIDGHYQLDGIEPGSTVVAFERSGFADGFQRVNLSGWETVGADAVLADIDGYDIFDAGAGGFIEVGVVSVDFQADSIVDAEGNAYGGEVRVEVTYLDPHSADIFYAPGDLTALAYPKDDSSKEPTASGQLISYGMADINLLDEDGERLQLEDGSYATVDFPVSNGDLPGFYAIEGGDTQQTWSFDTKKGMWIEEGLGDAYETEDGELRFTFEAPHFSWWNADQGLLPTCASGRVIDVLGFPIRGARVEGRGSSSGSSSVVYTDEDGYYVLTVLAGETWTFEASVQVGGGSYKHTVSRFIDCPNGEHFCEVSATGIDGSCYPVPENPIDVCLESGILQLDDTTAHTSALDEAVEADRLRAWFWEPDGDPRLCDNPWEEIPLDSCVLTDPDDYPDEFRPRNVGLSNLTRSAGSYFEMRTPRDTYRMQQGAIGDNPAYLWETLSIEDGELLNDPADIREGDTILAQAPGDAQSFFGPFPLQPVMEMPSKVDLKGVEGPVGSVQRSSGVSFDFDGLNNDDHIFVFVTNASDDRGLMCRYRDDGSVNIGGGDLGNLSTGFTTVSVYRPEIGWTLGPDGRPIRLQGLAGEIVEMDLK